MQKRTEQRRRVIRKAALDLFQAHGFRRVSMAEIARKAGVSPVTIYNYFGSREGLVRDVLQGLMGELAGEYRKMMESGQPFLEKLEAVMLDKQRRLGLFQGEFIREALRDDPGIRAWIEKFWAEEIMGMMLGFYEEGRRQGYIARDISNAAIMVYFEIIKNGFFNSRELMERVGRDPELMRGLQKVLVYGPVERKGWD